MDDIKRKALGAVRKYARGSMMEAFKGGGEEESSVPVNEPMPEGEGGEADTTVYFPGHEGGCSCEKCGAAKELGLDADSLERLLGGGGEEEEPKVEIELE